MLRDKSQFGLVLKLLNRSIEEVEIFEITSLEFWNILFNFKMFYMRSL